MEEEDAQANDDDQFQLGNQQGVNFLHLARALRAAADEEEEEQNQLDEMDSEQEQEIFNSLKNLGVEGINALQEMGIDLNNLQDLKGIAQLTESIGGVENLPQFLAALNQQNPEELEGQNQAEEFDQDADLAHQIDTQEEGQGEDKELQLDENIFAHLQQLNPEEMQQVMQHPELLQALLSQNN